MKNLLTVLVLILTIQSQAQLSVGGVNLSNNKSQLFTITTKNGNTYTAKKINPKNKELTFNTVDGDKKTIKLSQLDKIVSSGKKERHNYTQKYIKYSKSRSDLMTEIISGKISLYQRSKVSVNGHSNPAMSNMDPTFNTKNTDISYYIKKEDQNMAKYIKGNNIAYGRFKTNAIKFFSDCESLVSKLKNNDYKRKHLEEIVTYYNEKCE
ncbi:MAG: hypothetical protein IMY67_09555 [Bacteroidetes bacterium]|nr:hypothetical protein [Bacteroidota bacterium]